jgi:hypothetical protein
MKMENIAETNLSPAQQALSDLWDEHTRNEFATKDANGALDTMTPDAHVNHVPVLTGGNGNLPRRKTSERAHLLGPSFCACAARAFGFIEASGGRSRDREEGSGS